jgi:hypothetical protein
MRMKLSEKQALAYLKGNGHETLYLRIKDIHYSLEPNAVVIDECGITSSLHRDSTPGVSSF